MRCGAFLRLHPEDRRLQFLDGRSDGFVSAYFEMLWIAGDVGLGGLVDGWLRALRELRQVGDWTRAEMNGRVSARPQAALLTRSRPDAAKKCRGPSQASA